MLLLVGLKDFQMKTSLDFNYVKPCLDLLKQCMTLVCQSYVIRYRFINPIFECGVKITPFY